MLNEVIRRASTMVVRLALAHVQTIVGAERIYRAERIGLNRPEILRAAERRIEELGGTQVQSLRPLLNVEGQAIEAPMPTPRIVEGVGRARRHPGW